MDFKGQKLAERLYMFLIIFFGAVGFVAGYFTGDYQLFFHIFMVGWILAALVSFIVLTSFHVIDIDT